MLSSDASDLDSVVVSFETLLTMSAITEVLRGFLLSLQAIKLGQDHFLPVQFQLIHAH
jgi:hypothetical protein